SADERSEQFTLLKGHYYVESDSHCYSLSLLIKTWLRRGYFHYLFFTQAPLPFDVSVCDRHSDSFCSRRKT
ncbi:hypothetical protein, partial [Klebsiella variicola]|uniref:hypothetical protein n=1 Tax=Klebsiella variicola TaxID=244366 RepID=UPI001C9B8D04